MYVSMYVWVSLLPSVGSPILSCMGIGLLQGSLPDLWQTLLQDPVHSLLQ